MNTTDQELTKALVTLSKVLAGLLELNTTLAEIVTPMAKNLNDNQKADLLYALQNGRTLAIDLRAVADQLAAA